MKLEKATTISRYNILSEIGKGGIGENVRDFRNAGGPILDVRSPAEFEKGHIPRAVNFPLFSDEERAEIGILYKNEGRDPAVERGFGFVEPRLGKIIAGANKIAPDKKVRVHCWRGGLRSSGVSRLLKSDGFQVVTLKGGYKSYRHWVREVVSIPRRIVILRGLTGTGKTPILLALREKGEQVLDLEGLANHRGSSFGGLGMPDQPTTQHFENLIAEELVTQNPDRSVWIEAESGQIGSCWLPEELFALMKTAPAIEIFRTIEERLDTLVAMYGKTKPEELIQATERIARRLGGERTNAAVELIRQNDFREACRIILDYYDRSYGGNLKRDKVVIPKLDVGGLSSQDSAELLIEKATSAIEILARSV